MTNKIGAIVLIVSDLKKSIDFYQNKLEIKLTQTDKGYAEFATKGTILELIEEGATQDLVATGKIKASNLPRPFYLAWEAVENLDTLYRELKIKGVEFIAKPKTMSWGQRVAYFTDPDRNIWEISQLVK